MSFKTGQRIGQVKYEKLLLSKGVPPYEYQYQLNNAEC
uniref:Uncharacterized protein n=1 Tax=Klebsiella pneumoniae TaxID=573 RepID=A0A6M5ZYY1_KLEPN|nr:hypothetical protein [Klebsiella pneumoniae]QMV82462.1 hypothetical protein [Klebsiella pneumoniae]